MQYNPLGKHNPLDKHTHSVRESTDPLHDKFIAAKILGAIAKNFGAVTSNRGHEYSKNGRVSHFDWQQKENALTAKVKGTASHPYDVRVSLANNFEYVAFTECTCPVHYDCKHAAALLWSFYASLQKNGQNAIGYGSSLTKDLSTSELNPLILANLKELADSLIPPVLQRTSQSAAGSGIRTSQSEIVYVFTPTYNDNLDVAINITFVKKNGAYGRATEIEPFELLDRQSDDVQAVDRLIVKQWMASYPQFYDRRLSSLPQEQELSKQLVAKILATGRGRWQSVESAPIKAGPALAGALNWVEGVDGRFNLVVQAQKTSKAIKCFAGSLFYLDKDKLEIGCLSFEPDLTDGAIQAISKLPSVRGHELQGVRNYLDGIGAHTLIARPQGTATTEIRTIKPTPCLWLESKNLPSANASKPLTLTMTSSGFANGNGHGQTPPQRLDFAVFSLDYPEHLTPQRPSRTVKDDNEDKLIIENLDLTFERVARKELEDLGFTQIKNPAVYGLGSQAIYLQAPNPFVWARFVTREMDRMIKAGWDIRLDRSFVIDVVETDDLASDWQFTAEEGKDFWFNLELGIDINGERVSLFPILQKAVQSLGPHATVESLELLNMDGKFLCALPSGTILALPYERVRDMMAILIELFDQHTKDDKLVVSLLRANQLMQWPSLAELSWKGAKRLKEIAERLLNFRGVAKIEAPEDFLATLRDYQQDGLNWLQFLREFNLGGILADDMGLGKTVQALCHIWLEKKERRLTTPFLVVCPTSVLPNWLDEARRFTPKLKVLALSGPQRSAHFKTMADHDLVITTYPLIGRDINCYLKQQFHGVFLDEAQVIKNHQTKIRQCVARLKSDHRICLTGTPVQNHLGELWSLLDFTMPSILGPIKEFNDNFRTPIEKENDQGRQKLLASSIRPFLLRRTKEGVALELPPKTIMYQSVELEGDQRDLYETVRVAMVANVKAAVEERGLNQSQIIILVALLRLRQICCDPRIANIKGAETITTSVKLDALMELLVPLVQEGRRILLFSQFTAMLDIIAKELQLREIKFVEIRGSTKDRKTPVRQFQSGTVPVFLISLKAGGTGLNLTAADTVIHYDPWWNPAVEDQATDRAYRIGQDKPVFVYKLMAKDTIEDRMRLLQEKKRERYQAVLDGDNNTNISFSEEDLDILFKPLE